jgi:hypothetical protein
VELVVVFLPLLSSRTQFFGKDPQSILLLGEVIRSLLWRTVERQSLSQSEIGIAAQIEERRWLGCRRTEGNSVPVPIYSRQGHFMEKRPR